MNWIAILFIGLASGWALGLLLDFWFWGRRNRHLEAQLSSCRSEFQASETNLREALEMVSQYQLKEEQYQKCQYDLTDLTDKHHHLETQAENITLELRSSQQTISQLDAQSSDLRAELDRSHNTLEEVDRLIESSARRRIWNTGTWKSDFNRIKERSMAYARTATTYTGSTIRQAAGKFNGSLSAVKAPIVRTIDRSRAVNFLKKSYCKAWGLIGPVVKKGEMPPSCTFSGK